MKKYLRLLLVNTATLWLAAKIITGISFDNQIKTLFSAALALTIIDLLIKPLIKILLLPINLLTLGTFRWLTNVIALYLTTLIVPEFKINGFFFPGFVYQGFALPSMNLSTFLTFVLTSFTISLITTLLLWLAKD